MMWNLLEQRTKRPLHDLDFGLCISVEHGAHDDAEHQAHHVGGVEGRAVVPAIDLLTGERDVQRIAILDALEARNVARPSGADAAKGFRRSREVRC